MVSENGEDVLADLRYDKPGDPLHGSVPDNLQAEADRRLRYREGSEDGHCRDCGLPVWFARGRYTDGRMVTRDDSCWCLGPGGTRPRMERWHALPGMAQYVVPSPEGRVCHCLDRGYPHIHQIVKVT